MALENREKEKPMILTSILNVEGKPLYRSSVTRLITGKEDSLEAIIPEERQKAMDVISHVAHSKIPYRTRLTFFHPQGSTYQATLRAVPRITGDSKRIEVYLEKIETEHEFDLQGISQVEAQYLQRIITVKPNKILYSNLLQKIKNDTCHHWNWIVSVLILPLLH